MPYFVTSLVETNQSSIFHQNQDMSTLLCQDNVPYFKDCILLNNCIIYIHIYIHTPIYIHICVNLLFAVVVLLNLLRNAIMTGIDYLVLHLADCSPTYLLMTSQVISLIGKVNSVEIHNLILVKQYKIYQVLMRVRTCFELSLRHMESGAHGV